MAQVVECQPKQAQGPEFKFPYYEKKRKSDFAVTFGECEG
jgi:hypothetical protein